jgi:hypothetical protein
MERPSILAGFSAILKKRQRMVATYADRGMTFSMQFVGSSVKVFLEGKKPKKLGTIAIKPGMYLSQSCMRSVMKRLKSGDYVPKNTDPKRWNNNTVMYCPESYNKNFDKDGVAVDITGCYWRTAYNIGAIDKRTYEMGLKKDREFKEARNIAVGGLGAIVTTEKYVKGLKVSTTRERRPGACVRLDVIDHVYAMAQRIATKLGADFCMFLTDCFYVPEHRFRDVCRYIEEEGYDWKHEDIVFGPCIRQFESEDKTRWTDYVEWYTIDKDKFKWHKFGDHLAYDFSPDAFSPAPGSAIATPDKGIVPLLPINANLTP